MILSRPSITELEKSLVQKAMEKGDVGVGENISLFEELWAQYNGRKYGVSCNSGTNALFLALKALGVGNGHTVAVPEFTMIATAWAVSYTGATPVFVDCDDNLSMLEPPKTDFTLPVSLYGRPCRKGDVEDLAEGHGIKPQAAISCYSFYGNKILSTGEGGMCLTDDESLAKEMRQYANMYFDTNRTLIHPKMGYNFRMTNLQASIGVAQVLRAKEILKKRKQIELWYDEFIPEVLKMPKREVLWMYDIDCGDHQQKMKDFLLTFGIESRYFFKPMSMQPMYKGEYKHLNAYKWSKRGLYLPTYTDMNQEEVRDICKVLKRGVDKFF
jgi:perosamine synthetase